jgi:hypothetical protein
MEGNWSFDVLIKLEMSKVKLGGKVVVLYLSPRLLPTGSQLPTITVSTSRRSPASECHRMIYTMMYLQSSLLPVKVKGPGPPCCKSTAHQSVRLGPFRTLHQKRGEMP